MRDFLIFWWVFDAAIVVGYAANPVTHSRSELIGFATLTFGTQPAILALIWLYFAIRYRTIRPR